MKKYLLIIPLAISSLCFFDIAKAATLYLLPEYHNLDIGQEFFMDVKVNSEEDFINAVQTKVIFPANIEILDVDRQNSIFNFWIEDPKISDSQDQLTFVGGTAKGVSGESLQILRINCKAIGTGSRTIEMKEAVVTANDGKGTNILSTLENVDISVGLNITKSTNSVSIDGVNAPEVIEVPQVVERKAIAVKDLPIKPELRIPLYPNQETWYDHQGETTVLWEVPEDVIKVAISVDSSASSEPETSEEGLYNGKNIGVLEEGIHYVHVQFKNNQGWGEVTHHKISIDTTSPLAFETEIGSIASTNPSPNIRFSSEDSLSGYSHALVFIDTQNPITVEGDSFLALPAQELGEHFLIVRIFDKAGNSIEDDLRFEVLPLRTPQINFFTEKISQGEMIFISGIALPKNLVLLNIQREGKVVSEKIMGADETGRWEIVLDELLTKGNYSFSVIATDDEGAISLESKVYDIKVTAPAILSLGLIDLGWFEIFILIILIILIGGGLGFWYYLSQKEMQEAYKIIANRDVKKMSTLLSGNIKEIEKELKSEKKLSATGKTSIKNHLTKTKANIKKMDKYLGSEISKSK
ncbi:MAG: hypothetical protein U9P50_01075 [Patescibacteria group bacterium]|nr:hypothetical protein [Patescibacteria group bacterium]